MIINGKISNIYGAFLSMNTEVTYNVFGKNVKKIRKKIKRKMLKIENELSRFINKSTIYKINKLAGVSSYKVSDDVYELLSTSVKFSSYSGGFFDVTVAPLIKLWNYKSANEKPKEEDIKSTLKFINYKDIIFDFNKKKIGLKRKNQCIDLGGIAKGFAGDKIIEILNEEKVTSAFINIGGNVSTIGTKVDGTPWSIGIRNPKDTNKIVGVVSVVDKSVVTSGDYQRYFIDTNGIKYHHILNPKTGYPAMSGLISVTVISNQGVIADVLSTTLFILGMKKGIEILKQFPNTDVIFIDENLKLYVTSSLKNNFQQEKDIEIEYVN